jgi:phosphoribosylaminoimidazole carboxylase PurE protein
MKPKVLIVMGSDSDLPVMEEAEKIFKELGISYSMTVASAHRTPERAIELATKAEKKGFEVIIAGAGMAAHLAGVLASHTIVPVIGVPIAVSPLDGLDSLLSTVQMPPGVPVATMAVGKAGAKNAALFSAQIMSLNNPGVAKRLKEYRKMMTAEVEKKAKALEKRSRT